MHPLDKPGAISSIKCTKNDGLYVGQTGRAAKDRLYEHGVINHHDAKRSHSLGENDTPTVEPLRERRSCPNVKKIDYKALYNNGNTPFLTMGKTAVSEHIASFDHSEGNIQYKILNFESDWRKKLVKP